MIKKKVLSIVLTGSILIGGTGIGLADTASAKTLAPNVDIRPISAPVNETSLETAPLQTKFTDIEGHWAYKDIVAVENKGILKDSGEKFAPDQKALRADVVYSLEKLFGLQDIYNGPQETMTRIELAKAVEQSFLAKKLSVVMTLMFPVYDDTSDLSPEETSALSFVFNTGIMKGRTQQQFAPHEPVTKAELAVVLHRTLKTLELAQQNEQNPPTED